MKNWALKGKKVLIRVDFNVPMNDQQDVTDDTRIVAAIPTIKHILDQGAAVILFSHLGRPEKKDGSIDKTSYSMGPVARHLEKVLGKPVKFSGEPRGEKVAQAAKALQAGEVLVLENTRYEKGESKNDPTLAEEWSHLADYYVNDAFGTAHRAHASNAGVASFFTTATKSFGLLMEKEVLSAQRILVNPARPFTAILGGAKVSDKILLIENLIGKANHIIIGGGMAYTFMKAKGGKIGKSLCEEDKVSLAEQLLAKAKAAGVTIHLPEDSIAADAFSADAQTRTVNSKAIPEGWMGLDIGPEAVAHFSKVIASSKSICWNGPMGVFELAPFAAGTKAIAQAVASATRNGAFSLIGGGDSVAAVNQMGLADEVSFVSTGGGAMLTMLEGSDMPGIDCIVK